LRRKTVLDERETSINFPAPSGEWQHITSPRKILSEPAAPAREAALLALRARMLMANHFGGAAGCRPGEALNSFANAPSAIFHSFTSPLKPPPAMRFPSELIGAAYT